MITIGICDDDPQFIDNLYKILYDIMKPLSDWKARVFYSGSEVITSIAAKDFDCDLLFTDIFMENGSGLELAKYIFEHGIDTDLIFVTNSKEYVFECYHYRTFAYLLKPLSQADVGVEIKRYMEEMSLNTKCLNITTRKGNNRIPLSSIKYIESNLRKVIIYTTSGNYDYYEKLDTLENLLQNDGFVRCHQSYLVPVEQVTSYNITELSIDDKTIPISRRHINEVRELFEKPQTRFSLSDTAATTESDCYLTTSLHCNQTDTGAIICIDGAYVGAIIRIKPEQQILIGRDGNAADLIINLPLVSRIHGRLIYHADRREYEITDLSSNGTFINKEKRLVPDETYILKPGTEICFGDKTNIYKLG